MKIKPGDKVFWIGYSSEFSTSYSFSPARFVRQRRRRAANEVESVVIRLENSTEERTVARDSVFPNADAAYAAWAAWQRLRV